MNDLRKAQEHLHFRPVLAIDNMSAQDFRNKYLPLNQPLIIKNLSQSWPMRQWTLPYLKEKLGTKTVKVYNRDFYRQGKNYMKKAFELNFNDYLQRLSEGQKDLRMFLYNLVYECPELAQDIPRLDLDKFFLSKVKFLFFGAAGAVTQLHYDIDMSHVFHTVIFGKKTFYLFAPHDSENLYKHPLTVKSDVNILQPDFIKYPKLKNANGSMAELGPGDTLFMPAGYWHHVVYQDMCAGLSLRLQSTNFFTRHLGYLNLLLISPFDRLLNKFFPKWWFAFKEFWAQGR